MWTLIQWIWASSGKVVDNENWKKSSKSNHRGDQGLEFTQSRYQGSPDSMSYLTRSKEYPILRDAVSIYCKQAGQNQKLRLIPNVFSSNLIYNNDSQPNSLHYQEVEYPLYLVSWSKQSITLTLMLVAPESMVQALDSKVTPWDTSESQSWRVKESGTYR